MARVLLLARHFPPIGGAGVHRTLGTVRHLPAHGHEVVVVTGPAAHRDRWNPHDPALLGRIADEVEVLRLPGPEPAPRTGFAARLEGLGAGRAPWVRWWVDQCVRTGRASGADLVLASCLPYETALAAARLSEELGVPWLADLEDAWALDEMRAFPTALHRRLELRRMRAALASASAIITAAPEAAARLRRELPAPTYRVTGIPIGFERDDFASPAEPPAVGPFRIVHTGSLHTDYGLRLRRTRIRRRLLGGTAPGLDALPRSHVFLAEAVERLLAAEPSLRGRVELHLAGELTAGDRATAARHPFVRTPGLLSHRETVRLMRSADLLFLPMHDVAPGERAGLIPYKTYEYLAAERPILAAVPDGDVRDLLGPIGHATIVRPRDVEGMAFALRARIAAGRPAVVRQGIDSPELRELERARSVERIAAVVYGALAGARPPAAVAV
jgi:hypothetical protein